jgi:Kef-type K+ transport system membrane component KefB/nucleotide-binding universal stress UspA family protein
MQTILDLIPDSPIVSFTILLLVILTIPPFFERLKLPGLVGLLFAGVVFGPDGLDLLDADSETMKLLSDIGKIYLMFVAGLEIDLVEFKRTKNRSIIFGSATFFIPLITGMTIGRIVGFDWNASVLIGSLLASHTLLAYPIINRLGVVKNQAVMVTVGATIITDVSALLVLAICVSVNAGEFSANSLIWQLFSLGVYSLIVLFGFDWLGKEYFKRSGDQESNQFIFVLLAVFLAAVGAELIHVEKIVGAFLAGLAVNDVVGKSPVEEKVIFVGSTLFIPFFFVDMGLLLNISGLISSFTSYFLLTFLIVGGLIGSKFLAALFTKIVFKYNWDETFTMWSLSLPQVAATLAATLVGVKTGILDQSVFNAVIVLMLVTSILGPILTDKFARKLPAPKFNFETDSLTIDVNNSTDVSIDKKFNIVISVYNNYAATYLTEMGALLALNKPEGMIIPVAITKSRVHMDDPLLEKSLKQSESLLNQALEIAKTFNVKANPIVRIDDEIAEGISRTAKEQNADLIVMGWSSDNSIKAKLFGNIIDQVFWASHCPVAVMRLLTEPINIHRLLVPIKNLERYSLEIINFALLFAYTNKAEVTLLHVCNSRMSHEDINNFKEELKDYLALTKTVVPITIKIIPYDNIAKVIMRKSAIHDLIVLRSVRRRTTGGLAISDVTTQVISEINCSIVLFGDTNFN